jgi:hypothetical protein
VFGSYAGPGTEVAAEVLSADDGTTVSLTPEEFGVGADMTFPTEGRKTVTLTVTDSGGGTATATPVS